MKLAQKSTRRLSYDNKVKVVFLTPELAKQKPEEFRKFVDREGLVAEVGLIAPPVLDKQSSAQDEPQQEVEADTVGFAEYWKAEKEEFIANILKADEAIFTELYAGDDREMYDSDFLTKFEDVKDVFPVYLKLQFIEKFLSGKDCRMAYGKAVQHGKWSVIESMISTIELEWQPFEHFDFTVELTPPPKFSEKTFEQMLNFARKTVAKTHKLEIEKHKVSKRWSYYLDFIMNPTEIFSHLRQQYVESYFRLFDIGITYSLINSVYYGSKSDKKPLAANFINWKVPDSLRLEDPLRIIFPPLVCADRKFSCNHAEPDLSILPRMRSVADGERVSSSIIERLSCRVHPGKLLLLLVRMDNPDMVEFALNNGLSAETGSNMGHCTGLKWTTETIPVSKKSQMDAVAELNNFSELELARARDSAQKFSSTLKGEANRNDLQAEYSELTPLSVAVENAVYGTDIEIVCMLLEAGANPLFCSDVAVKSCVNAVSLLSTPRNQEIRSIPKLPNMKLEKVKEKPKPKPKEEKRRPPPQKRASARRSNKIGNYWLNNNNNPPPKKQPTEREKELAALRKQKRVSLPPPPEPKEPEKKPVRKVAPLESGSSGTSSSSKEGTEGSSAKDDGSVTSKSTTRPRKPKGRRKFRKNLKAFKEKRGISVPTTDVNPDPEVDGPHMKLGPLVPVPKKSCVKCFVPTEAKPSAPDLPTKERVARKRADKCLKVLAHVVRNQYQKLKQNHFTKILLYQACVEKREDVIGSLLKSSNLKEIKSKPTVPVQTLNDLIAFPKDDTVVTWLKVEEGEGGEPKTLDLEMFELLVNVFDTLLNNGLQKIYPSYAIVLEPILRVMEEYHLYPNAWRFLQLFRIIKCAMELNIGGDQQVLLRFMKMPQMLHYLGLDLHEKWEARRWENLTMKKSLRNKLRIEHPTMIFRKRKSKSEEAVMLTPEAILSQNRELTASYQTKQDKLLKYATRMQSLPIIEALVNKGAVPSIKAKYKMVALAVKGQDVEVFRYIYQNFAQKSLLTKAFVIALKGKYHHSMQKLFELGFDINFGDEATTVSGNDSATSTRPSRSVGLGDDRIRQTLSLFSRSLEDVLFERTVFDCDNGRRHKENFTRQDEEHTFKLLVEFLVEKVPRLYMERIVRKIISRAVDEYESRIWFYGLNDVLEHLLKAEQYDLIDKDFIEVYKLNYGQWVVYSRDLQSKFEKDKKMKQLREARKSRIRMSSQGGARRRASSDGTGPDSNDDLDTEEALESATRKVKGTLHKINRLTSKSVEVGELHAAIMDITNVIMSMEGSYEKTPRTAVAPECRRHGSRNFDYMMFTDLAHGSSPDL